MHQRRKRRSACCLLLACTAFFLGGPAAPAVEITLERPGEREFVRDLADMIDADAETHIRQLCDRLLRDKATPIIVVTIQSMAEHGGEGMRIETFATLLFNQWQIGHAELGKQYWNTGILLLVSKGDRKARIELGAGWGHREDALCRQIMDQYIIAQFKRGRFSEGIVAGVEALDTMARRLELPSRPRSARRSVLPIVLLGLGIFTVVSLVRRGTRGWAWLFWSAVFAVLAFVLYSLASSRGSSSGGGFSGGSFGGGFSGGGGATGSW